MTFRLDPIPQSLESPHWGCSEIGAVTCWVNARDAADARSRVVRAVGTSKDEDDDLDTPMQPWRQADMSTCVRDDSVTVPDGIVLTEDGDNFEY